MLSREIDAFTQGYIECMLWADGPEEGSWSEDDLAPEAIDLIIKDCTQFQQDNVDLLAQVKYNGREHTDLEMAGHDFWLTRKGHGAGYWDGDLPEELGEKLTQAAKKFSEWLYLYVGEDGKIHLDG